MSKYFPEPVLADSVKLVTKDYQIASFYKLELRDSAAGLGWGLCPCTFLRNHPRTVVWLGSLQIWCGHTGRARAHLLLFGALCTFFRGDTSAWSGANSGPLCGGNRAWRSGAKVGRTKCFLLSLICSCAGIGRLTVLGARFKELGSGGRLRV